MKCRHEALKMLSEEATVIIVMCSALQAECGKFGVRCLPKKKMVEVLEKIYYGTHPGM